MQITNFIGIDVSKKTLDLCLVCDGKEVIHAQGANTKPGIRKTLTKLMRDARISPDNTVFVAEHTGMYCLPLVRYLRQCEMKLWLESAVQIKRSMGLVRGKSDRVDAARIAMYAYKNRDAIKLFASKREVVEKLSHLVSQRDLYVKVRKQMLTALGEQMNFLDKQAYTQMKKHARPGMLGIKKSIAAVEKTIRDLIGSDERLSKLYAQVTSVDGIGPVTAAYMLVTTNEFTSITDPRKFACYSGVAPFERTSGTSIRGRKGVSHMANKKMKTLLHLAAMTAIQTPGELSAFYQRKKAEGKHHLTIINAIRNKLVHRIFACVNQDRYYQKNLNYALVNP